MFYCRLLFFNIQYRTRLTRKRCNGSLSREEYGDEVSRVLIAVLVQVSKLFFVSRRPSAETAPLP